MGSFGRVSPELRRLREVVANRHVADGRDGVVGSFQRVAAPSPSWWFSEEAVFRGSFLGFRIRTKPAQPPR